MDYKIDFRPGTWPLTHHTQESGQALLGCPATHILEKKGLTATIDLAPTDLLSEG